MRRPFPYLLLAFIVLGIFYPVIFAESLSTDDQEMIQSYVNMTSLDWQGLFWPTGPAYYYRPLLGLSFYSDWIFFGSQNAATHLVNILIHLANTILLYRILLFVSRPQRESNNWPLLAAIFFGLHPLVTEPVNWISGRTDLLAGFFVLASLLLFMCNTGKKLWRDSLAAFLFLCGLWSKEVAIGLLPVVAFACLQEHTFALKRKWREIARRTAPFFTATILYLLLRTSGRIAQDIGVMSAIRGGHGAEHFPLAAKLSSLIKAIGFYSQKIIWPFPLNFAIIEVNRPVAMTVGIATIILIGLALFFWRRRPSMLGLVWICCFLAPALPVAVNRVAWTPLAERYLYLPLMGLCLLLVMSLGRYADKKIPALAMTVLLMIFGAITAQRNIVWQKNITLWQDVVEKSPNFAAGHNDYALALQREGKSVEAKEHLAKAESLATGTGKNLAKSNAAIQNGDSNTQLAKLAAILQNEQSPKLRAQILYKIIRLLNGKLQQAGNDSAKQRELIEKSLHYQKELAKTDKNPYHTYCIGQFQLALGDKTTARANFALVCETSNDYYTKPACTLAEKLAREQQGEKTP